MITHFPLIGLSRQKSVTCTCGKKDSIFFWPRVELTQDRFDALWKFCSGNWDEKKYAVIEHDGIEDDGEPINPRLIDVSLKEKAI